MKKVFLVGFILAAAVGHVARADVGIEGIAAPDCPKAFQGFHLGGNIGYGVGFAKQKFSHLSQSNFGLGPFTLQRSFTNDLSVNGVDGGIGVGYTYRVCNWALGLSFDANWAGTSGEFKDIRVGDGADRVTTKARLRNSLQLYGRLGYVIREVTMPFIGLGWDNSQWKQNTTLNVAADPDAFANPAAFSQTASKSKRYNAFLWKAGVDFLATKHVVVGFEYTGTVAGRKSSSKEFINPQTGFIVERITGSLKPQYNKFSLTAKIVY